MQGSSIENRKIKIAGAKETLDLRVAYPSVDQLRKQI
jgi:hypothetical protein